MTKTRCSQINHSFKKDLITFRRKHFFLSFFLIEVQLIYNILSVSGVQHSDSEFLQIICHYRLLQDIGIYLKKTDFFFFFGPSFPSSEKKAVVRFFLRELRVRSRLGSEDLNQT